MKKLLKPITICLLLLIIFSCAACGKNTYTVTFMKVQHMYETSNGDMNYKFIKNTTVEISKGEVIGTDNSPSTNYQSYKYIFAGWYTEKEFINKWDLNQDEVKSNITLYPKYVKK